MTRQEKSKKKKIYSIIGKILGIILFGTSGMLIYSLISIDILPSKYLLPVLIVLSVFVISFLFVLLNKKCKYGLKNFIFFLSVLSIIINVLGFSYINKTYNFFDNIKEKAFITEKYYVMVNNKSKYEKIDDLDGKNIKTFNEGMDIYNKAIEKLNHTVNINVINADSVQAMAMDIIENKTDSILISEVHKSAIEQDLEEFSKTTKVIYTIKIKVQSEKVENHAKLNLVKQPFTLFISGADSYGTISDRSRSDVNMLVTINPTTHEILMTSIPRDYYVQLHNTTGMKDKLTHAGIYGVNKSVETIEDLMGIDIDYYVKVNFSTLIKVVDTIGGVDVYSDASFIPWTDHSVTIKKGTMHMDGKTAIAFARERHAYLEGDRHRAKNQQDVLTAIIKKVSSSTVLLTKYSKILDDLSESFETNLDFKEIASLVKLQLDQMPSWNISQYTLNGSDAMEYTYSFGAQKLYVMIPDEDTITKAKEYIASIKNGKKLFEENNGVLN